MPRAPWRGGWPTRLGSSIGEPTRVAVVTVVDERGIDLVVEAERSRPHDHPESAADLSVLAAVRGEPHDLVLTVVCVETEVLGDRGVEPAKREGNLDAMKWLQCRALTVPYHGAIGIA